MSGTVPLVFNPRARSGKGTALARQAGDLLRKRGVRVTLTPTDGPGSARSLVAGLAEAGASRILVIGGDGTLSEAADGALRSGKRPALGFLPGGTGNDFLLEFGLQRLEAAVNAVAVGKTREIDAALVTHAGGERHCIDVFGTGFMAKVAAFANRRLKWVGARGYTLAVFPELARFSSPMTRLVLDGRVVEERFGLIAVCNGQHAGGGMRFAPMAEPDDGRLEVVALRDVSRVALLRLFPKLLAGTHIGHPKVFHASAADVEVVPEAPSPLLADGEVFGETPARVRVLPRALSLMMRPEA